MKKFLILAAAVIMTGCFEGKDAELGPEETVEVFCKAMFAGEFDKAESMCDTLGMQGYIDGVRSAWEKADSSVMTIVPAILSETAVEITEVVKNGQARTVFYKLTAANGSDKEKTALLRKEEGAWKIREITDRH